MPDLSKTPKIQKAIYFKDIENVIQAVLQVPIGSIYSDMPVFAGLAVWNLFVLFVLSKKVYEFALKKGRSANSSMYFSREYY
jgi:hypothetical protein